MGLKSFQAHEHVKVWEGWYPERAWSSTPFPHTLCQASHHLAVYLYPFYSLNNKPENINVFLSIWRLSGKVEAREGIVGPWFTQSTGDNKWLAVGVYGGDLTWTPESVQIDWFRSYQLVSQRMVWCGENTHIWYHSEVWEEHGSEGATHRQGFLILQGTFILSFPRYR